MAIFGNCKGISRLYFTAELTDIMELMHDAASGAPKRGLRGLKPLLEPWISFRKGFSAFRADFSYDFCLLGINLRFSPALGEFKGAPPNAAK